MAIYLAKPFAVDAFQYGFAPNPDWFTNLVHRALVTTHASAECGQYALFHGSGQAVKVCAGEIVAMDKDGKVYAYSAGEFARLFDVAETMVGE